MNAPSCTVNRYVHIMSGFSLFCEPGIVRFLFGYVSIVTINTMVILLFCYSVQRKNTKLLLSASYKMLGV